MGNDNLTHCFNGCCFFINGLVATREKYEEAKRLHPGSMPGIGPRGRNAMLEGFVVCRNTSTFIAPKAAEERTAAFEVWSASHRPTAPLSDYAVSRDGMHEGREH
jgi:hypothetical protein